MVLEAPPLCRPVLQRGGYLWVHIWWQSARPTDWPLLYNWTLYIYTLRSPPLSHCRGSAPERPSYWPQNAGNKNKLCATQNKRRSTQDIWGVCVGYFTVKMANNKTSQTVLNSYRKRLEEIKKVLQKVTYKLLHAKELHFLFFKWWIWPVASGWQTNLLPWGRGRKVTHLDQYGSHWPRCVLTTECGAEGRWTPCTQTPHHFLLLQCD